MSYQESRIKVPDGAHVLVRHEVDMMPVDPGDGNETPVPGTRRTTIEVPLIDGTTLIADARRVDIIRKPVATG